MKKFSPFVFTAYFLVAVYSLKTLAYNAEHNILSLWLVAALGAVMAVLFFVFKKHFPRVFYVWCIVQLITISHSNFNYDTLQMRVFDLGVSLLNEGGFVRIHFIPLFFLLLFAYLWRNNLLGKRVAIDPVNDQSAFRSVEAKVVEVLKLEEEGRWLKVEYKEEGSDAPKHWMIRPKDEENFSAKSTTVAHVNEVGDPKAFLGWAWVRVLK